MAIIAGEAAWHYLPRWVVFVLAAGALLELARFGRPEGRRIVAPARVPPRYEPLTQDVIVRALGSLGLAGINQWLREEREIVFAGPVRQDGPRLAGRGRSPVWHDRRVGQPGCLVQLPQRCRDGGALRVWQLSGEGTHPLLDLLVQEECTTAQLN